LNSLTDFICGIPKCELHLHIEGTLEPELMFRLAGKNSVPIKYKSVQEVRDAYNYNDLQGFLNIYYDGAKVLIDEEDFYDLTTEYLLKARSQNILHSEIFFDPQTHTNRGIRFSTVINGIYKAMIDAEKKAGITSKLIMCFLRDLDEKSAFETLKQAEPFTDIIAAVGLDSAEVGNPPAKFENVFKEARAKGFLCVAHAGEEGPAEYIHGALNILNVNRIDHGNNSRNDEELIARLAKEGIPLTMCPLSNLKLKVVNHLKEHPLKKLMEKNVVVTINSDDPAYFGGYLNENYIALAEALNLTKEEIVLLAGNSFKASFLSNSEKEFYLNKIKEYISSI
jgi:adenosine deaminase